jgi:hypothetical protein
MAEVAVMMRRVVPALWQCVRRTVEDDPALNHDQAAYVRLDCPELV